MRTSGSTKPPDTLGRVRVGTVAVVYDRVPGIGDVQHLESTDTVEVLRATDLDTGDAVTVRILNRDITAEQFAAFAETCRRVRSVARGSNVARLYDAGTTSDGRAYLVTEHQARSLGARLAGGETLRWQEAVALGAESAAALDAAHRAGAVHGGMTPQSVLLADDDIPVLDEFGLAAVERGGEGVAISPARLAHAAPEVIQGHGADERSDVYSLASTLYAAITGTAPFARADDDGVVGLVSRQLGDVPASLATVGVPPAVDAAILGALAKDPAQRPASAALFRQELLAAARTAAATTETAPTGRLIFGGIGATSNTTAAPAQAPAPPHDSAPLPPGRRADRTRGMRPDGTRPRRFDAGVVAVVVVAIIAVIIVATRSGNDDTDAAPSTPDSTLATTAAPTSVAPTAAPTAAPTTLPAGTDPVSTDPLTSDPTGTDVSPTTAPLGPNTVALEGTGFHATSFTSSSGYSFTFPADRKYHYFEYSFTVTGNKYEYACPMRSRYSILDGPGIASLSLGSCVKAGETATLKMRAKAFEPTKLTFNLFICDWRKPITYCEVRYRASNPIKITIEATPAA